MAKASESKLRAENEALREDIEELRLRLGEAEQALEAIRTGKVESLVVEGPEGPRIFSLEGATQSYRVLVEAMNEGAVTLSDDGRVLYCNARFAAMVGQPLQTVMGSSVREHIPERSREAFDELVDRARESAVRKELTLRTSDGHEIPAYLSVNSIVDDGRRVLCLVATDLREQRRTEAIAAAEKAARESEERLRQTLRHAAAGTWEWDIPSGALEWSPESYELYGMHPATRLTRADWERMVHPDDLAASLAALTACIEGRAAEYRAEFRVRHPRLGERWLLGVARLERAADGTPLRMLGINIDVTERKRVEHELRKTNAALQAINASTPVLVALKDRDSRIVLANPAVIELIGRPPAEVYGHNDVDWFGSEVGGPILENDRRVMTTLTTESVEETTPGGRVWLSTKTPWRDPDGNVAGVAVVSHEITARKAMEEALRDADRRKDEFLGMLSHELRNPLAPIRNSTYILRHAQPGSEQAQRAQTVIERQTQHLTRLVDDLLDVTRIARGKIELRRDRADLRDVVRRTAEDFRSVVESRGVAFRVDVPAAPVWADADVTRLAQAIGNLLQNAAKFTRRGDSVSLSLESDGTNAQLRVADTGAGIDPSLLPRVFTAFVQGERTLARSEGGLGLGLALVKGIVELHGGTVNAESAGTGQGAAFTIRLPVAGRAVPELRPSAAEARAFSGRRVLVVDDNVDAAETLAETLKIAGHEVEVAFDGPSAIERVRINPPDVVLCDIGLPGMTGYEVARRLRASGVNGMQLIAVSGYAQPEDVKKAVEAGFDGHVAKPCDPEQIGKLLA